MVNVKSNLNGDIRRFLLPSSPTFSALQSHLSSVYNISPSEFVVKYKDDEGDLVTMSSDAELSQAISSTPNDLLRIQVSHGAHPPSSTTTSSRSAPAAATEAPTSAPTPSQEPEPSTTRGASASMEFTPEQLMSGLAGMFANMVMPGMSSNMPNIPMFGGGGGNFNFGGAGGRGRHAHHPRHGRHGMRGRGGRAGQGAGRGACGGDFLRFFNFNEADIASMIRDFDPESLGSEFRNIQPATIQAMRTLGTGLMQNPGPATVMAAVPAVMPEVRSLIAQVNSNAALTTERIDALEQSIRARLNTPLGVENANRVGDFVRLAAQDEAVLNLLRRVNGIGANWGNDGSASAERDAEIPTDRPVPQHPLSFGSRGPEVIFLQHVLTNMGYMTPADYSMRAGVYGPRTAAAVNRFQSEFNIPTGPYDQVTAAALLSVTETGVPPSAATGSEQPAGQTSSSAADSSGSNPPAAA